MWLRGQFVNHNLRQNAQIQDADSMQAFFCVINDTLRCYISTKNTISSAGAASPKAPYISAEAASRDMQLFKTNTV